MQWECEVFEAEKARHLFKEMLLRGAADGGEDGKEEEEQREAVRGDVLGDDAADQERKPEQRFRIPAPVKAHYAQRRGPYGGGGAEAEVQGQAGRVEAGAPEAEGPEESEEVMRVYYHLTMKGIKLRMVSPTNSTLLLLRLIFITCCFKSSPVRKETT